MIDPTNKTLQNYKHYYKYKKQPKPIRRRGATMNRQRENLRLYSYSKAFVIPLQYTLSFHLSFETKDRPNGSTLVSVRCWVNQSHYHSHASSLTSSAIYRWFRHISLFISELVTQWRFFAHQNLIYNWLTYAKSTGELISFGFSDRSVRSLVSAKRSANRWVQTKTRIHFFGWSLVSVRI